MRGKEVRTVCRLCFARCRAILHVQDGRIEKVDEEGPLCPKGRALGDIVHAPDRLLHPLKRDGNGWRRVSWDEALGFIARRLEDIRQRYGPQALAIHAGHPTVYYDIRDYIRRFGNLFGTPNLSSTGSQCHVARVIGNSLTCGSLAFPDYERTNCIVLWGCNPSSSNPYAMRAILNARKRGAKLIVIDPRVTPLVSNADVHLQLRPGTDRVLALGILHTIVRERLYDRDFVAQWTLGFDRLEEALQLYDPERVQGMTGVPADLIRQAARLYSSTRPACIVQGNALEHHTDGVQAIRAISILQAVSGNLDVPGGSVINPGYHLADIGPEARKPETRAIGADVYPLYYEFTKQAQANLLAGAILEGRPYPIRGMIVVGANSVLTFPNSRKVREALGKLEFLAVMDHFLTETAEQADIILPAATFLERTELCDLGAHRPLPRLALISAAIPEQGEAWPDWRFWFELARRMGYGEYFPWKDIKEAIAFRLKPLGITIEQLERKPDGIPCGTERYRKYEEKGFATPSGKVEIYSERLERLGYDPLPTCRIGEGLEKTIILSTGARVSEYIHSRFRNIPSLRRRRPEPLAEISSQMAQELGLNGGDRVTVKTETGKIEIKVKVNNDVVREAVFVPHGWNEVNANVLTDDRALDLISGFPSLRSVPCAMERKAASSKLLEGERI